MGEYYIFLVPTQTHIEEPGKLAELAKNWLVKNEVILDVLKDDEYDHGYEPHPKCGKHLTGGDFSDFDYIGNNGLEIITKRELFTNWMNDIDEILCPNCGHNLKQDQDDDWTEGLGDWIDGLDMLLACKHCNKESPFVDFKVLEEGKVAVAYSNVAFKFNNWPMLSTGFIDSFGQAVNCRFHVIPGKI